MSRSSAIIESSKKEPFAWDIFESMDKLNRCYYETREYATSNRTPVSIKFRADRKLHYNFMHPEKLKLKDLSKVPTNKRKIFLEKRKAKLEKEKGKGEGEDR